MFQLQARAQAEIEIKKSRFIGIVQPVSSREEALARLAEIRAQWPDARHYCAVLLCGADSMLDDDGEPSGTAARPMYNVLRHKDVCDVLAVVSGISAELNWVRAAWSEPTLKLSMPRWTWPA